MMDILIYFFIVGFLTAFAVLAYKFWSMLGVLGGIIGAVLSYSTLNETELILRATYDLDTGAFVYQTYPIGFLSYIPLVLTFFNFIMVLKKK